MPLGPPRAGPPIVRPSAAFPSSDRSPNLGPSLGYEIDQTLGVVMLELLHTLDVPQLAHAFEVILRDPTFRAGAHVCVDCRHVRSAPSREQLFAAGAEVRALGLNWQTGRIGIVVRRSDRRFASRCVPMTLPASMIARTRVVIDLPEALRWFDVGPSTG